jgi:hypothetical protein
LVSAYAALGPNHEEAILGVLELKGRYRQRLRPPSISVIEVWSCR